MEQNNRASENQNRTDYGPNSYVGEISADAKKNQDFRRAYWTGGNMQMTLMNIQPRGEIGTEVHPDTDQLIRVESGKALVRLGKTRGNLSFSHAMDEGDGVFIRGGTWHNIYNTGSTPLKLTSIYAPPQHPYGTIHRTAEDAEHEH